MIITAIDIYSRIYSENVEEITRGDDTITARAIDGASEEAQMYLSKYDVSALFGTADTAPSFNSPFLRQVTVDLAVWQLVRLGNPNINYDAAKTDYENAVRKLRDIQAGKAVPPGWPYAPDPQPNPDMPGGDAIIASYRRKKNNYFY